MIPLDTKTDNNCSNFDWLTSAIVCLVEPEVSEISKMVQLLLFSYTVALILWSLFSWGSSYNLIMPNEIRRNDKSRLISLSEAASLYGFNPDHLRHLAQKRRLQAQKIGNSWVTTPADVEEYIRSRKKRGVFRDDIQLD